MRQNLLASGSDSGVFSIWDLRTWQSPSITQQKTEPAATFLWHKSAITAIEWAPHDESMLVVSGADDQISIWDLSLERDAEEEAAVIAQQQSTDLKRNELSVPAQLLFIHQGQKQVKEVHWHKQIPGLIVSTSAESFNVFKTINS
ncbi:ribosome biosynthesis protein rrb1 [Nowakowskiella sp. JEL0078]|nr:ribosome biosynthesis protein rrb1 [Nowakowskiella sp. JEL0078]